MFNRVYIPVLCSIFEINSSRQQTQVINQSYIVVNNKEREKLILKIRLLKGIWRWTWFIYQYDWQLNNSEGLQTCSLRKTFSILLQNCILVLNWLLLRFLFSVYRRTAILPLSSNECAHDIINYQLLRYSLIR